MTIASIVVIMLTTNMKTIPVMADGPQEWAVIEDCDCDGTPPPQGKYSYCQSEETEHPCIVPCKCAQVLCMEKCVSDDPPPQQ